MAPTRRNSATPPRLRGDEGYFKLSTRPLHVLVFLLPFIVLYEMGSLFYLADTHHGVIETIRAWSILSGFFEAFGVAGFHLPAIALVIVLFAWHYFLHDPWRVKPVVIAGMGVESALWCLPLLVFGMLVIPRTQGMLQAGDPGAIQAMPWQARLTLSIGAGLYEELLFRLILISLIHFIVVDLCRQSHSTGFVLAAIVSAVSFAFYHNIAHPGGGADIGLIISYTFAGLYFAILFLLRGFGVAVATHALYDIVVLVAAPAAAWG